MILNLNLDLTLNLNLILFLDPDLDLLMTQIPRQLPMPYGRAAACARSEQSRRENTEIFWIGAPG